MALEGTGRPGGGQRREVGVQRPFQPPQDAVCEGKDEVPRSDSSSRVVIQEPPLPDRRGSAGRDEWIRPRGSGGQRKETACEKGGPPGHLRTPARRRHDVLRRMDLWRRVSAGWKPRGGHRNRGPVGVRGLSELWFLLAGQQSAFSTIGPPPTHPENHGARTKSTYGGTRRTRSGQVSTSRI